MRIALQLHQIKNDYIDFIRFSMVGIVNTSVDFAVYIILSRSMFLFTEHYITAKVLSFIAATVSSFYFNRQWAFNKKSAVTSKEVIRFYSTVGSAIFINVGVVYFLHSILGIYDLAALFVATLFTIIWGFAFSQLWVFKQSFKHE